MLANFDPTKSVCALERYNVPEGGLLPFGMILLALSPWIAGTVRGVV
jgi:hypothetical protein